MKIKIIIVLLTIFSAFFLQSCGRKGQLYLPDSEQIQEETPSS